MLFAAYSDEEYNRWLASLEQAIKYTQLEGSVHSREFGSSGTFEVAFSLASLYTYHSRLRKIGTVIAPFTKISTSWFNNLMPPLMLVGHSVAMVMVKIP